MIYFRHNRLTFTLSVAQYQFRRRHTFSSMSLKIMVVVKKAYVCCIASPNLPSYLLVVHKRHFLLNKRKIYRSYFVDIEGFFDVFNLRFSDFTWSKSNHDLGHQYALDFSVDDKNIKSLLDAYLHIAAKITLYLTLSQSRIIYYFEKKSITRNVLMALNILCFSIVCLKLLICLLQLTPMMNHTWVWMLNPRQWFLL